MPILFAILLSSFSLSANASLSEASVIHTVTQKINEALDYESQAVFSEDTLVQQLTGLSAKQIQMAEDGFGFSRKLVPIRRWKAVIDLVPFDSFVHYEQISWVRQNPLLNIFWGTALNTSPDIVARFAITHDATSLQSQSHLSILLGPLQRTHTAYSIAHTVRPLQLHLNSLHVELRMIASTIGEALPFLYVSGLDSKKRNSLVSLQFTTHLIHQLQDQHFQRTHRCDGIL